ncbi:MAG: FtsH protease activity modulator HflK [Candidatus Omnitrophica bacterium]|nr:FtsH protease activity modulator HflK [Candidatus Omnitrophota bacterium]MDD5672062.1 FtsH protease activity modulator HflK [Candidatus Omnitrophota bacterium]
MTGLSDESRLPPLKAGLWGVPFIVFLIAVGAIGSMFYQVGPDELGVVQRFGRYVRSTNPGLHGKLPFGIETVRNIKVTHVFKEEFGFRTVATGVRSTYRGQESVGSSRLSTRSASTKGILTSDPLLGESMMLTGDLNTAVVEWIVQYRVKDAKQYAFRIRNPRETLRNMSEASMRLVIGDHTINQVLTAGRESIQSEVEKMLQEVLDSYGAGIEIRNVILQDVTPPDEVKPSFNFVNEARQEKEKVINQAWEEYNRVIPRAKGEAEQQIRAAEGYALDRINRAEGDAERFLLAWAAYKGAPEVTKRRIYLESLQETLPLFQEKWILDDNQKGLLPLLNLTQHGEGGQKQ